MKFITLTYSLIASTAIYVFTCLLFLLLLVACSPTIQEGTETMAKEPTIPTELTTLIAEIKSDLAERTEDTIPPLISIEKMTWEDSSLGCSQPDMMYMMMLVEGYKVIFGTDETTYHYHTAGTNRFILCE